MKEPLHCPWCMLLAALSVLLLPSFASSDEQRVTAGARLKFAAILPLSGNAAAVGEASRNGITMALEKLPAEIRGRIDVSYEDDAFSSKQAVSAFNKLLSSEGMHVLLNLGSGTGNALAPVAEREKVTFISISSDGGISRDKKHVFNFWVTPEEEARVAVNEAVKRGYKTIARIATLHEGAVAVKEAFDKVNAGRLSVVLDEEFPSEMRDFRTFVAKLGKLKVDAVMVVLLPGQCGIFAKALRESGQKQDMFAIEAFEDPNEVRISNGALLGQWYVNADEPDDFFASEYRRRFPNASLWGALNAHDAVLLTGAALERGYEPRQVHSFLRDLRDFKGALGTYSSTGDNKFALPATVKVVTPSGFEKLYK